MLHDCSLPFGSGLSSSAAIGVSTIAALSTLAREPLNKIEIALTAQRTEREYAGVNCGIMDQFSSACGKRGFAMLLDCKTLDYEYLPLNFGDYSLIITDSRKKRSLTDSCYNERRDETELALKLIRNYLDIDCLAELTARQFNAVSSTLPNTLKKRVGHVVSECERVKAAAGALKTGNIKLLGELINKSHFSLSKNYEVTGKELDTLAEISRRQSGCIGSRMIGGGFGGCTISLVKTNCADEFQESVYNAYLSATGYKAKFYDCEISDGITVTKL